MSIQKRLKSRITKNNFSEFTKEQLFAALQSAELKLQSRSDESIDPNFEQEELVENFKFALSAAKAGTWFLNIINDHCIWDERALEIYGVTKENFDCTSDAWRRLVHPDDIEAADACFKDCLQKNARYESTHRVVKPSGEIVYVLAQGIFKHDKEGNPIGAFGLVTDVTEQVLKEHDLVEAKQQAEIANKAKSEFLANMSHEIRTPMNAVLGFSEILKSKEKDAKKAHYIDNIHISAHALLNLINDILDLSKIEAGKLELQYNAVSISSLFKEIETVFKQKITDKGLNFIVDCDKRIPRSLIVDEIRLRQIIINLVGNAIKFTEAGHIRLSAKLNETVKHDRSQIDLSIEVEDTGIGISEDQQIKIFGAFEQTKGQKTAKFGGTGLGLAITSRLVEMMGGTIFVESELGRGAAFRIVLNAIEVGATKALEDKIEKQVDFDTISFEAATILIADDIDFNREMLTTFLMDWDFTFHYAENGREAIEQAKEHKPDLILLDMKMPEMDGYEALSILNDDLTLKNIPVIAVTASALTQDEEVISKLCNGYLRKPVSKADLIFELMKFLPNLHG